MKKWEDQFEPNSILSSHLHDEIDKNEQDSSGFLKYKNWGIMRYQWGWGHDEKLRKLLRNFFTCLWAER